jgi:hypothetical protein
MRSECLSEKACALDLQCVAVRESLTENLVCLPEKEIGQHTSTED